eukprot:scaffold53455_cov41-Cyclotella_meneghiniana.AAC.6
MTYTRKEKATPILETRREGWANPEAASVIRDTAGLYWSTRRKVKAPAGEVAGGRSGCVSIERGTDGNPRRCSAC